MTTIRIPLFLAALIAASVAGIAEDAPKAPEKPTAADTFEAENFKFSASKGVFKKHAGNGINSITLHTPAYNEYEGINFLYKDGAAPGLRELTVARLKGERACATDAERKEFAAQWKPDKHDSVVDTSKLKDAQWLAQPACLLLDGPDQPVDVYDAQTWEKKPSRSLRTASLAALVFHARGIYRLNAWGYAGPKLERPKLIEQMRAIVASFCVLKETTLAQDYGFSCPTPQGLKAVEHDSAIYLYPERNGGEDGAYEYGTRIWLGYRCECMLGTGNNDDPAIEGKKLDEVMKLFARAYAPRAIDKGGMNTIAECNLGRAAKCKFAGLEGKQIEAAFRFVCKHQAGDGGGVNTTVNHLGVSLTAVETRRGALCLLATYEIKDKAEALKSRDAIRDGVKLEEANVPKGK